MANERSTGGGREEVVAYRLRGLLEDGACGLFTAASPAGVVRLQLREGELALLSVWTPDQSGTDATAQSRPEAIERLGSEEAAEAARLLAGTTAGSLRFEAKEVEELGEGSPLPTYRFLMEVAATGRDTAALRSALGGRRVPMRTVVAPRLAAAVEVLEPEERRLLTALLHARTASDLAVGEDEDVQLRRLVGLRALGLIAEVTPEEAKSAGGLTRKGLDLFVQRVAADLDRKELELSPKAHRGRVAELLRNVGIWTHYEMLGIDRHDAAEAVHRGYLEVARIAHPVHAGRLGLEGHEATLDTLFEAVTRAYLRLNDPDRRREYDRELGPEADLAAGSRRQKEKAGLARDMYRRAERLFFDEDYQVVMELMQQAIQLDPQADYYALLAEAQSQNPRWQASAAGSFRDAVRCRPDDPSLRTRFARMLEGVGDVEQAGVQLRAALELTPEDEKIQDLLDAFEARHRPAQRGLLDTLKELLRR